MLNDEKNSLHGITCRNNKSSLERCFSPPLRLSKEKKKQREAFRKRYEICSFFYLTKVLEAISLGP